MAELILSAALPILIEKAIDLFQGEYRAVRGVEEDCQKLCRILPVVQAVIEDAENRCEAETSVREWVRSLKAAAYEAEDVLDELKYDAIRKTVETKIQLERKAPLCLPGCSLFKNNILRPYSNGKRLKAVLEKIDALIAEMNKYRFLPTQQPVTTFVNRPESQSYVIESTIIGRNDDLENIVARVLSQAEMERIAVLPIVGMGGLGKTTLTQLVYKSDRIQKHFELKLWVCVSDEFHVNHLAKKIIDLAIGKDSKVPLNNRELISQRLRAELGGKRYLLILDDVWNEVPEKWGELKLLLDCGSPGSVVIVTTRSQNVGQIVHTMDAYNLQELNENDLWGIFRQKAFQMGVDERPELIEIGKQLMKKCCGSPLVATTLGGLMSYKKEQSEWLDVLESDKLIVEDKIMAVLKLSYDNLSSHLKRCFAFCAVYPKDFLMERDTLIQLWMANSYIPSKGSMEIEAEGVKIFKELEWRGFFQEIREDKDKCKMHDLIHDLAQTVVGTACVSLSNSVQQSDFLSKETFHVSSLSGDGIYNLLKECSSVHTILLLSDEYDYESDRVAIDLSKVKSCRALTLSGFPWEIHVEPKTLKHLRYLDLSCCGLEVLPDALCFSYNLQTIVLNYCLYLVCLPKDMRNMCSLRHVYLLGCRSLEHMPAGLGQLSCLQTLTKYIVDPTNGCGIEQLKDLTLGGVLELCCLEKVANKQEAKLANLISKKHLSHLELSWGSASTVDPNSARDVLESLEPYQALQSLQIRNYDGIQFAEWMHNSTTLRNLTKLTLWWCMQSRVLWPIWQLPSLEELKLQYLESLKHICSGSALLAQRQGDGESRALPMFPNLQELLLQSLNTLENWQENDPAGRTSLALPKLKQLHIIDCQKLDVLPSCPLLEYLFLENLESLRHICCNGIALLNKGDEKALPTFPQLKTLRLISMLSLERWHENDSTESTTLALPQLCNLWIGWCPKLDALPSCPSLSDLELIGVGLKHICCGGTALSVSIFPMLQTLKLNHMSSFKRWQENDPAEQTSLVLPQLRTLRILRCPKLDALPFSPSLSDLYLMKVGLKHICCGGSAPSEPTFPMLQTLKLEDMSSLERWQENDPAGQTSLALPQLRELWILVCPKLDTLPSCPLLIKLEIYGNTNIQNSVIESLKNNGVRVTMW